MPMNAAKLLLLNVLGGSAVDTAASFTVTTTGAQTLTIHALTVSAATTVDWGDGSQDVYTGSGTRTHNYAGAGTWTMRILQPLNVTVFRFSNPVMTVGCSAGTIANLRNLADLNLSYHTATFIVQAGEIGSLRNLTALTLDGNWPGFGITVAAGEIGGLTGLTSLRLHDNLTGVTMGAAEIGNLTNLTSLRISATEGTISVGDVVGGLPNLQTLWLAGNQTVAFQTGLASLHGLTTLIYEKGLTTAQVDNVLGQLWAGFASRTATGGTIDLLGGGNLGPTGPVAAENPPTYGGAYAYELVNDTGSVNPTKKWTSVTTATPV